MKKLVTIMVLVILYLLITGLSLVRAQERTIGLLINEDDAFIGYTLFAPMPYTVTYLIDNNGLLINSWESDYRPGLSAYLCENGNLLGTGKLLGNDEFPFTSGSGGIVQEISWDGSIVWEFEYTSLEYYLHHDIEPMPNGNVLMIAWEYKSGEEAIEAGRNPDLLPAGKLWPDHIIEVEPSGQSGGDIVWEWHMWDHLIQDFDSTKSNYGSVEDHPELMDINFFYNAGADWNHINSINYNEELDQILLSLHNQSEIFVIDHSTTTEEAAGHTGGIYNMGGDFLYRWGNPVAYRAGSEEDRKFFKQHDARWVKSDHPGEGNITVFNNGRNRPEGNYSSIDEIEPPIDSEGNYLLTPGFPYEPEEAVWIYTAENPSDFYSQSLCGAHRLPNGNTLISYRGEFFEITPDEEIVWLYINPVNSNGPMEQGDAPIGNIVFFIHRYAPDFPGFEGHDMTPGDPIEGYPTGIVDAEEIAPGAFTLISNYPNPFNASTTIEFSLTKTEHLTLSVYDLLGRKLSTLIDDEKQAGSHSVTFDASGFSSGVYFCRLQVGDDIKVMKMNLLK